MPAPPGSADDPSPDYLLQVATPESARAALEADAAGIVLDGRATAWLMAGQAGGLVVLLLVASVFVDTEQPRDIGPIWVLLVAPVVLLAAAAERLAGISPPAVPWQLSLAVSTAAVTGALAVVWVSGEIAWGIVVFVAVLGLGGLAPLAGRWRGRRRGRRSSLAWPQGAQAFAILSVLDRVDTVAPSRLAVLAGIDPRTLDPWIDRLRSEWALSGGRRRHRLVGDQRVFITEPGRERLGRMRRHLEELAQPCTSSTAPTSPDVTSARSSSEVT